MLAVAVQVITFVLAIVLSIFIPPMIIGSITGLCLTASGIAFWVFGIKGFFEKQKLTEQRIAALQNSPEYKAECAKINEKNRLNKENIKLAREKAYQDKLLEYKNTIIPQYENELRKFETEIYPNWEEKAAENSTSLSFLNNRLTETYSNNIVPGKYRTLEAMTFIAAFMGTSQYDLKFAIERYDKEIDQLIALRNLDVSIASQHIAEGILEEQQYANYLDELLVEYNDYMLQTIEDSNNKLGDIRALTALDTAMHAKEIHDRYQRTKGLNR